MRLAISIFVAVVAGGTISAAVPSGCDYSELSESRRSELLFYARCARAAYPGEPIPEGLRAFTAVEWSKCGAAERDAGYRYDPHNGFLSVATGFRARLMVSRNGTGRVVLSFSGCDLAEGDLREATLDARAVYEQMGGYGKQLSEAERVVGWVSSGVSSRIDLVGHSLGGCMTTYVVARRRGVDGLKGWTFNGLGLSAGIVSRIRGLETVSNDDLPIVNVRGARDPVFKCPGTIHFGEVITVGYPRFRPFVDVHGINELINRMSRLL